MVSWLCLQCWDALLILSCDMQIFLVGTAHVSRNSAEEVRELIHVVKPSTIMVELCRKRADKLRSTAQVPSPPLSMLFCQLEASCGRVMTCLRIMYLHSDLPLGTIMPPRSDETCTMCSSQRASS